MSASFEFKQLMSAFFENLSYWPQCTSSIWTECKKWCVVMLRFPCLHNTWALKSAMKHPCTLKRYNWRRIPVTEDQSVGRKCAVARTYIILNIERTSFHTPLHRAYWRRTHAARAWRHEFSQMGLIKIRTSHRSLRSAPTGIETRSHSSTRSGSTLSFKHSIAVGKQRNKSCFSRFVQKTCDRTSVWQSERSFALKVLSFFI